MCQAIGKRYNLTLLANVKKDKQDLFRYYGVKNVFTVKSLPMPSVRVIGRLLYLLISITYIFTRRPWLIYTRDFFSGFILSIFGYSIIYECHEIPLSFFKKYLLKKTVTNKNTLSVVCISERMKHMFMPIVGRYKINTKTTVAHDGIDTEPFISLTEKKIIREKLKLPLDKYLIGYTGNLFEGRGINIILELATRYSEDIFVIVGGYEADIRRVKKKIVKKKIDNVLLIGFIPPNLIPQYLASFDILLMPYQYKVMLKGNIKNTADYMSPLKMFEYMASGRPIISSRLTVLEEVLKDKTNALLVEPNNIKEWYHAIMLLKKNRSLAQKIGEQARTDVKNYSWDNRVKNIFMYI